MWIRRVLALIAATAAHAADNKTKEQDASDTCSLYLAVSSTSTAEHTVWGLYAGKDMPSGTLIGPSEVGVVLPHLKANSYFAGYDQRTEQPQAEEELLATVDWLESTIWIATPAGAKFELLEGRAVAAIPGIGALSAYHSQLVNAAWEPLAPYLRPTSWQNHAGQAHVNRGSISPFYHIVVQSTTDLDAGSEIFMDYGENWAEEERQEQLTMQDYQRVDETVQQMIDFFAKHKESLNDESQLQIYQFLTRDVLTAAIGKVKAQKVSTILPKHPQELPTIPAAGGALKYAQPNSHVGDVEWLQQHGRCMDLLKPGPSTIPFAGRGAFATRKVPKGGLVAPVPLIHIPNKDILNMHHVTMSQDGDFVRESDQVVGQQLLMNYVFGHKESSMVFYPAGSGVSFINHSDKPNAKLVWSQHPSNAKHWFDYSPQELLMLENQHVGLLMEVVATRDIEAGEEVFLDYGPEWKAAWDTHVVAWNRRIKDGNVPPEWPLRAADMMDQYGSNVFKTEEELRQEPYPETVQLKCYFVHLETHNAGTEQDPMPWGAEEGVDAFNPEHLQDCVIVQRRKVDGNDEMPYTYKVRLNDAWHGQPVYVDNVPHGVFVFVDAPETSDQFMAEGAFRHYIGIPDDIFPQGPWRNLA